MALARQCTLNAPSAPQAFMDGCVLNSEPSRPLLDVERFPVECKRMVASLVVLLVAHIFPFAVFFGIISVIINSFDGQAIGAGSHVF